MRVNHHNPAAVADRAPADEVGTADEHFERCGDCGAIHRVEDDHTEFCPEADLQDSTADEVPA